jgi:hypothetical protein
MKECVRGQAVDHRGTRTGTMRSAPEQFRWYAPIQIQLISAFFKAIQAYSNLFKEKISGALAFVTRARGQPREGSLTPFLVWRQLNRARGQ